MNDQSKIDMRQITTPEQEAELGKRMLKMAKIDAHKTRARDGSFQNVKANKPDAYSVTGRKLHPRTILIRRLSDSGLSSQEISQEVGLRVGAVTEVLRDYRK
jgi:DNA-binding NarL/FixJ family response regulator